MKKYKYSIRKNSENCPDILSKPLLTEQNTYYRMIDSLPISKMHFVPHYYLPGEQDRIEQKRKKNKLSATDICRYCSVSIFKNIDDFVGMTETNGKLREKIVVEGIVCGKRDGHVFRTPSGSYPSHYDWFPFSGIMETRLFERVVYENGRIN